MDGGKLLGYGTYGCIFYPAIKCKSNEKKKGVGKVFSDEDELQVEYEIGKQLQHIDKNGKYLNVMVNSCDVDVDELMSFKKGCKHLKNPRQEYKQLIYKEKGMDFSKFLKKTKQFNLFDNTDYVMNLLKGVELIQKHKLVHLDIKQENLLISDSNKLLLIDFGMMRSYFDLYNVKKSEYILEHAYPAYPIEFKIYLVLKFIVDSKPTFYEEINTPAYYKNLKIIVVNMFIKNAGFDGKRKAMRLADKLGIQDVAFVRQFDVFLNQLLENMQLKGLTHISPELDVYFAEMFGNKADVFSVGNVLMEMMTKSKPITNISKRNGFINLLKKIYNFNAFERITVTEAIKEYKSIINSDNTQEKPTSKVSKEECLKNYRVVDLKKIVDEKKLAKKLKQLNKEQLCESLLVYL
jgi:serine/threonine protein kinase